MVPLRVHLDANNKTKTEQKNKSKYFLKLQYKKEPAMLNRLMGIYPHASNRAQHQMSKF